MNITDLMLLPARAQHLLRDATTTAELLSSQTPWGVATLATARRIVGFRERGGNNLGPEIDQLRRGRGSRGAWCAAADCYVVEDAYAALYGVESWDLLPRRLRKRCPLRRSHGARRWFGRIARHGAFVQFEDILPGDRLLWDRGIPGRPETDWQAHIGMASARVPFRYFAGNEGLYPARYEEHDFYPRRVKRFYGAARLPRVVLG